MPGLTYPSARRPDRAAPRPLWAQVLADLRRRLAIGEFGEGFPTDRDLVAHYGVSRHTAREAVRRLQDEGVVARERGRGTFVRTPHIEQVVGPIYSLFRSVEDQGFEQHSRVLTQDERRNADVAAVLGTDPDETFVYLHRVRLADDVPIAVDEIWMPSAIAGPLLEVDFSRTAVYDELQRLAGCRPTGGYERIRPGLADPSTAAHLGIGVGDAVFLIERSTDTQGRPLEWRRTVGRGDAYSFVTPWGSAATVRGDVARPGSGEAQGAT